MTRNALKHITQALQTQEQLIHCLSDEEDQIRACCFPTAGIVDMAWQAAGLMALAIYHLTKHPVREAASKPVPPGRIELDKT